MKQREKLWTQGAWSVVLLDGHGFARPGIDSPDETIILWGAEGDDEGVHGKSSQQAQANAQLISAAPDLVEALEVVESKIPDFGANTFGAEYMICLTQAEVDQIRVALNAAYGDSQ